MPEVRASVGRIRSRFLAQRRARGRSSGVGLDQGGHFMVAGAGVNMRTVRVILSFQALFFLGGGVFDEVQKNTVRYGLWGLGSETPSHVQAEEAM